MFAGRLCLKREKFFWVAMVLALAWLNGLPLTAAHAQGKTSAASTRIRLATPTASLSYLPIYVALQKGFFAKRGFDMEVIQMAAGLAAPALLNRAIDYTTIPSGPAKAGRAARRSKSFASHR
jgi:ABC-type nitrate/sulfonate/bicarbonate transport system substrate-binding protein